jgi:hypothetical protein
MFIGISHKISEAGSLLNRARRQSGAIRPKSGSKVEPKIRFSCASGVIIYWGVLFSTAKWQLTQVPRNHTLRVGGRLTRDETILSHLGLQPVG